MKLNEDTVIGTLVAGDYRTATVFQSSGIDFCCNGNRTIREACEEKGIDSLPLLYNLQRVLETESGREVDYNSWRIDLLADYIEQRHHRYVESRIPEIKGFLSKIVRVHGSRHPELHEIELQFGYAAGELAMHMKKEELILFPFIRKMVKARETGEHVEVPHFVSVDNPIAMMMHEHDTEGERFRKIAALSYNYTSPPDGCNTYKVTYALLQEFEKDLHLHIHLENNILFPKAKMMEREVVKL